MIIIIGESIIRNFRDNVSKLSISGENHVSNEMLNLQNGSEEESNIPNLAVCLRMGHAGFFLSCHFSGFPFRIKQNTFVNVYYEFFNSTTATPF